VRDAIVRLDITDSQAVGCWFLAYSAGLIATSRSQ
jgi:hypothetical protein